MLPDGCRDIVIHTAASGTTISLTSLDLRPRKIQLTAGDTMTGYRLRPGLHINANYIKQLKPRDISDLIMHAKSTQTDLSEAIQTLGHDNTPVHRIAKQLGVSLRTLQRHLAANHLPPPEFWRLLGRARRAAISLGSDMTLSDIADSHGYSDQSHLTRACQHWFGHTPKAIRKDRGVLEDITQPALGTWGG